MPDQPLRVAYIADGKLFIYEHGRGIKPVESPFVEKLLDRAQTERDRNSWKDDSVGWNAAAGNRMPFGLKPRADAATRRIEFTGLDRGNPGELVYALDTNVTAGLFRQSLEDHSELRMYHRQGFRARDLARHPDGTLAMSLRNEDGTAHIAIMAAEGRGPRPCTEGDVVDEHPSWIRGETGCIVYQSAGIGRNQQGMVVAYGPYSIVRMDMNSQNVETLMEDSRFDFLSPRVVAGPQSPASTLYFIRRPYQIVPPVSLVRLLSDVLLFPYRVCRAIVHFLHFFSMVFARKPLITASGPPRQDVGQRYMMLWGKMIDAEEAMRNNRSGGALVPKNWELIKRDLATGEEVAIANSVVSFDLDPNGEVVWSNGAAVFRQPSGSAAEKLLAAKMVERVVVAG